MSWRTVCITKRCKLELSLNTMIIRGEETTKIHLSEIGVLIIESTAVSLTTSLLAELVKQKVKIIFCDEKHNPISELIPCYGSHDTSAQVRKQLTWDTRLKQEVWTHVIQQKITNQRAHLYGVSRDGYDLLDAYLNELEFADASNREGHAAKVYFSSLFGVTFTRGEACSINDALNYGYSILLSLFNREIVATGSLTQIGINHRGQFNHFNFSSDLMEPFRIFVDMEVYKLSQRKFELDRQVKHRLIHVLESDVRLNGEKHKLNHAAKLYVQRIIKCLNNNTTEFLPVLTHV